MPHHIANTAFSRSSKHRHKTKRRLLEVYLRNKLESDGSSSDGSIDLSEDENYHSVIIEDTEDLSNENCLAAVSAEAMDFSEDTRSDVRTSDEEDEFFDASDGYSTIDDNDYDKNEDNHYRDVDDQDDEELVEANDFENNFENTWDEEEETQFQFDDEPGDDHSAEPLYPNSPISVGESIMMILQFYLRHKISNSALGDLLELIKLHCPGPNQCIKSLYFFRKWLQSYNVELQLKKHYYCKACSHLIEDLMEQCPQCEGSDITYFITIPVESQLKEFFARPGFYYNLQYRFNRVKEDINGLEDIYDGQVYERYMSDVNDFDLKSPSNISFMWNSDGVPLFKSSQFSIWPLFLKINELPPKKRNKPPNMLLAGLWFGSKKPDANIFLEPLRNSMTHLYDGENFDVRDLEEQVKVRAIVICGTCDLPAKAIFLNMVQFNGTFGCHKCLIKTEKLEKRRVYTKYDNLRLRTLAQNQRYASEAYRRDKSIYGVKGPTILTQIVEDYVRSTVIDPMHLISGISKMLLSIWFDPSNKNHRASLLSHSKTVNKLLSGIAPPSFVERKPRTLDDSSYWKASELITWLLVFSLPILTTIMPQKYLNHHTQLVYALYLCCQKSVLIADLTKARTLLLSYVSEFKELYGEKFMTCNLHSLLHLCQIVQDFGPLSIYSCFPFENANGILKSLLHATRDAQLQIYDAVSSYVQLDSLKSKFLEKDSNAMEFCNRLERKGTHRLKLSIVHDKIFITGVPKKLMPVPTYLVRILETHGIDEKSVYEFSRLMINGEIYASKSYTRAGKTNSTCIDFSQNGNRNVGIIQNLIRVSNCSCKNSYCKECRENTKTLAVVQKYQTSHPILIADTDFTVDYIYELDSDRTTSVLTVIDVSHIHALYYYMKVNNREYAIKPITLS
uniref:Transposase domain-containing protein n=1 Tax=Bracon brevicornis TaxID=1563983 RepID=A0A6V7IHC1_9HYME